jgi:hypothetical protein
MVSVLAIRRKMPVYRLNISIFLVPLDLEDATLSFDVNPGTLCCFELIERCRVACERLKCTCAAGAGKSWLADCESKFASESGLLD